MSNTISKLGVGRLWLNDTEVTATAAELNALDGITATVAELNILDTVTATAAELNAAADNSVQAALIAAGAGFAGTGTLVKTSVVRTGNIIETTIAIDLTGTKSKNTVDDIIGNTGAGAYICRITTAINGIIYKGTVDCGEVPTTGDDDIDLWAAAENTGAYDGLVTDLTETALMTAGGAHAIGTTKPLTALPAANAYLYLTSGNGDTAGTYDAGKLLIRLWGVVES